MFYRVFLRNDHGNHIGLDNKTKLPTEEKLFLNPVTGLIIHSHKNGETEAYSIASLVNKQCLFLQDGSEGLPADKIKLEILDRLPVWGAEKKEERAAFPEESEEPKLKPMPPLPGSPVNLEKKRGKRPR